MLMETTKGSFKLGIVQLRKHSYSPYYGLVYFSYDIKEPGQYKTNTYL